MQTVRSGWANWCASFRFSWSFSQPLYQEIPQRNLWMWILSLNLSRKLKPSTTEMLMLQPLVKRRKRRSKANSVAWVKATSAIFRLGILPRWPRVVLFITEGINTQFPHADGHKVIQKTSKNIKFTSFSAFLLSVIFFRSICDWVCCRFTLSTCTTSCLNLILSKMIFPIQIWQIMDGFLTSKSSRWIADIQKKTPFYTGHDSFAPCVVFLRLLPQCDRAVESKELVPDVHSMFKRKNSNEWTSSSFNQSKSMNSFNKTSNLQPDARPFV